MLSTASMAPCLWASSAMAAMSRICSSGLVGVSIQTSFVFGVMIVAKPAGDGVVGVAGDEPPRLEDAFEQAEGAAVQVGGGDHLVAGPQQRASTAVVAARPEAKARPRSPPSSAARHVSRAVRVGLPLRRVLVALVLAGRRLGVGRGGVDRHDVAPVAGSASWPAWMARVLNPIEAASSDMI